MAYKDIDQQSAIELIRTANDAINAGASNDIMLSRLYTALVRAGERRVARLVHVHIGIINGTMTGWSYEKDAHDVTNQSHDMNADWAYVRDTLTTKEPPITDWDAVRERDEFIDSITEPVQ